MIFPKLSRVGEPVGFADGIERQRQIVEAHLARTWRDAYKTPEEDDPIVSAALTGQRVLRWFQDDRYVYDVDQASIPGLVRHEVETALPEELREDETVGAIAQCALAFDGSKLNRAIFGIMTGHSREDLVFGEQINPSILNLAHKIVGTAERS